MPEQRRRFSPQFRAEAVQMVIETGKPIAQVARDLGIHDGTLGNWVNAYRRAHAEPEEPLSPVERARVKEMEDEIRRLRMEKLAATSDGNGIVWFAGGADVSARTVSDEVDQLQGSTVKQLGPLSKPVQGLTAVWNSSSGACVIGGSTTLPNA